jgi:3-deoxy-D-manno-octulosonic-acid transferase
MHFIRTLIVLIYSLLVSYTIRVLVRFARLFPKLREQLSDRKSAIELSQAYARMRSRFAHSFLFFCSSAGEYEQAKPLLDRLARRGDCFVLTLFFSKSGMIFAKARGEKLPVALTPMTDSVWEWGSIFAAIRPDITAIMRHEIWPGFLTTACHYSRVYLIDASSSLGERKSLFKRAIRKRLLRKFDQIYTVSADDHEFFAKTYGLSQDRLQLAGDTKYDRVMERALSKKDRVSELDRLLEKTGRAQYRLIVGSAHKADVDTIIAAYKDLGTAVGGWQVILVPHHVDDEMLTWTQQTLKHASLPHEMFSNLQKSEHPASTGLMPFVVVDRMGLLAELYATSHAALVGGAFHHQVHNVLEPACHGLALAWGPNFKNSQEAINLVHLGLADVIQDSAQLAVWWRSLPSQLAHKTAGVTEAVAKLCGASDKIMTEWQTMLGSNQPG